MKPMNLRILPVAILGAGAVALLLPVAGEPSKALADQHEHTAGPPVHFDADGAMLRPAGYREWIYAGTPLTPNDLNDGEAPFPEFHTVYIAPDAWAAYQRTGRFPDGTCMVKELISVGSKQASSGNGYFMGEFIGLEVAMKDSKRFHDQPGHWSYFSFGHEYPLAEKARPQRVVSCNACHQATAAEDFVFTQYYPVLRAAKPKP